MDFGVFLAVSKKSLDFCFSDALAAEFRKKHYGIVGNHSAVEICSWNKKALQGKGVCYKQIFYGIECAACAQFSPSAAWCNENCVFCWRPNELMSFGKISKKNIDAPQKIISGVISERKKLLSGFGGRAGTNRNLFEKALMPSHWAISLSGEPTLYPRLLELIELLKKRKETKSVFLVSNGLETSFFKKLLKKKSALPSQLYISFVAPDQKLFFSITKPCEKNAWKSFLKTLPVVAKLRTRKIARLTLIKGINDSVETISGFVRLLKLMKADFVEVKGYMFLGFSRKRLKQENMPLHSEVVSFAKKLLAGLNAKGKARSALFPQAFSPKKAVAKKLNKALGYKFLSQARESRIVLLGSGKKKQRLL